MPLRSALYLPASNNRAIDKARTIAADAIVFDLEDSVAPQAKQTARDQLHTAFEQRDFGGSSTVIRTNPISSSDYLRDLDTVAECKPDALLLPKVSTVGDIETFEADAISRGIARETASWFMIENAAGIVNLADILSVGLQCRYRLTCLVVGHNDLALDTGVSVTSDRYYLLPWLMQIILLAKHQKLAVLDSVYNNHKNLEGFEAEAMQAKAMGFTGKSLIHPAQVDICNRVYSPTDSELESARAIVAAFALPENSAAGVISLEGRMVERLHLEQAQQLLHHCG